MINTNELVFLSIDSLFPKWSKTGRRSNYDTMLSQCNCGQKGRSAHAAEARGSALGRSTHCLKLDCILCIFQQIWFLGLGLLCQQTAGTST